jgi:non-specific protein-tyrosine kinase
MASNVSLLEHLRRLQEEGENGLLVLVWNDERLSISYREGVIQRVSLNRDTHWLGRYLVRDGLLTEKDVLKIVADARKAKVLFGEAAVKRKYLEPAELAEVVRRQALDLLVYAFDNAFVPQTFNKEVRAIYGPAGISFAQIQLELSRVNPVLLDADRFTLFTLKGENLSSVSWLPVELSVLGELSTCSNIAALTETTGMDEATVRRILGVLHRLGIIEPLEDESNSENPSEDGTAGISKRPDFPFEQLVPIVPNAIFSEELEIVRNPSSFISEQFKALRVRIREESENPPRVLAICSPEAQDGKSIISVNLALALSMEPGRRTVIIDCDLRSPTLDRYLGVSPQPGLIQYLSNGKLSPYCQMRRIGNLYFMGSGGVSDTPTELLSLRKMKDLIEELKRSFHTVIVDAPPFSPIADAQIISGFSDSLVVVIRQGKTSNRSIENAFKILDRKKLLGVVLNDVEPRLFNTYLNRYQYNYQLEKPYSARRRIRSNIKGYLDR